MLIWLGRGVIKNTFLLRRFRLRGGLCLWVFWGCCIVLIIGILSSVFMDCWLRGFRMGVWNFCLGRVAAFEKFLFGLGVASPRALLLACLVALGFVALLFLFKGLGLEGTLPPAPDVDSSVPWWLSAFG